MLPGDQWVPFASSHIHSCVPPVSNWGLEESLLEGSEMSMSSMSELHKSMQYISNADCHLAIQNDTVGAQLTVCELAFM
jgi:hypothetical protein